MKVINHVESVVYSSEIEESKKRLKSESEEQIKNRLFYLCDVLNEGDYNRLIILLWKYLHEHCKKKTYKRELFRRLRNHAMMLEGIKGVYTGANANALVVWDIIETARINDHKMDATETLEGVIDELSKAWEENSMSGGSISVAHITPVIAHAKTVAKGLNVVLEQQIHNIIISDIMYGEPIVIRENFIGPNAGTQTIIMNRMDGDDDMHLFMFVLALCEVMYELCGEEIEEMTRPLLERIEGDTRHFEDERKELIALMACGYARHANLQCGEEKVLAGMLGLEYAQSDECKTIVENLVEFVGRRLVEMYLNEEK